METSEQLSKRLYLHKNFNIRSTIINDNIRISTASIFYESSFFGDYYQFETFIFKKEDRSIMKIHNVLSNQNGIEYCINFHNKLVSLVKSKLNI